MKFHHAPLLLIFSTAVLIQESTAQLIIFPPIAVSADNLSDAEEVSIVVNPLHPDQLAAGSNVNYFFYSPDKGSTWTGDGLSSIYGEQGDPSLVADSKGNIFYAHLSNPAGGYWLDRIVIQKSTDGGRSYSAGVYTGHRGSQRQQDKEWLSCDLSPTSPYRDNVYMPWTEFDSYKSPFPKTDSSRILFSRSTDGGAR